MNGDDGLLREYQRRTRELEALYETAGDLSSLHDVDDVLAAIVRRSRQLLGSDVAYLMLLDSERNDTRMRVGEGIQTPEFMTIRLALGEGIAGKVAQSGMPLWTSDYPDDENLSPSIDMTVRGESLVAILGVPLAVAGRSLGVLLVAERHPRHFRHDEVALLTSLANHAAVALENAALLEDRRAAASRWQEANAVIGQQNRVLERAAELHESLTRLVLEGASIEELAQATANSIGGQILVVSSDGTLLTPAVICEGKVAELSSQLATVTSAACLSLADGQTLTAVPVLAGGRRLGHLVRFGDDHSAADTRALERAAMVTALLLLNRRADEDARVRAMGDLLTELSNGEASDLARARRQAQAAQVIIPAPPFLAVVGLLPPDSDRRDQLDTIARLALRHGWLARVSGRQVSVLAEQRRGSPSKNLVKLLADEVGGILTIGVVEHGDDLTETGLALDRALMCAKVLEVTGQIGRAASPEELGLYTLLLSDVSRDRIDEFIEETLGVVFRWDSAHSAILGTTLEKYFAVGGRVGPLAESLSVHQNTAHQRLERLDRLLGPEWRRGDRLLQVHLALRLARLRHGSI